MYLAGQYRVDDASPVESLSETNHSQLVDSALKSFNKWSYKRSQPSDNTLLRRFVSNAIRRSEPISFVMYWGKGRRTHAGINEDKCLTFLTGMAERICEAYNRGASFDILYTDTHAHLNGYDPEEINFYGNDIRMHADPRLFTVARLSEVCRKAKINMESRQQDLAPHEHELTEKLVECAAKWYRGDGCARKGALDYFRMNMIERLAVQEVFPNSIFITFNGADFRAIFPPNLPIFYMYSIKKGTSVKPWFMD